MTINEYQKLALTTLNPELSKKDVLINGVMGLCGESGEAIDIVKKHLHQGHELDREKLIRELGDIACTWRRPPRRWMFLWKKYWSGISKSSAAATPKVFPQSAP